MRETQQYWSGYSIPSPWDLPFPGLEPWSPTLQVDSLPAELPGKPHFKHRLWHIYLSFLFPCQDTEEVDSHSPLIFCTHWSAARWLLALSMWPFMTCRSLFLFNTWCMSLFLKCDQWSHLYHGAAFVKTSRQAWPISWIEPLAPSASFPTILQPEEINPRLRLGMRSSSLCVCSSDFLVYSLLLRLVSRTTS